MKIIKTTIVLVTVLALAACTSTRTRELKPSGIGDNKAASEVNVQLAAGYIQRKQFEVAKQKLDKAIELDDDNVEAYKLMAYLMSGLGKNDEAEDYYLQALDVADNDPEVHNGYGAFLCKMGRIDEALDEFRRAYENPYYQTAFLAYSNAGSCLLQQENYSAAESLLRKALRTQPKLPGALISMAEIGVATGKYLMARAYVQRYHAVARPTAESLWLQAQAEKALGAQDAYDEVVAQLLDRFPDSPQAQKLQPQRPRPRR